MIQKIKYFAAFPVAFAAVWTLVLTVWFVHDRDTALEVLDRL